MNNKHIVFFSKYCQYCYDFLTDIVKKGLRQKFILVCIEKHPAPSYVDRVPFIMTCDKKVVLEQNIPVFVEKLMEEESQQDNEIMAYAPCPRGHFGSEYCSIDDTPKKNDISSVLGYVFLDEDEKYNTSPNSTHKSSSSYSQQLPQKPLKIDSSIYGMDITIPQNTSQSGKSPYMGSMPSMSYSTSSPPIYNPNITDNSSEPQLPSYLQPKKIEKTQKTNDAMYESLLQQRMNEVQSFQQRVG